MRKQPLLREKPWFNILVKILIKTKQLLVASSNNLLAPSNKWNDILAILVSVYRNKLFFNQSVFGGNKKKY